MGTRARIVFQHYDSIGVLGSAVFLSEEGGPTVNMERNLIPRKEENGCIDGGLVSARCSCVRGVGVAGASVLDYQGICISLG